MKTSRIIYRIGFGLISVQMFIMGIMQLLSSPVIMNNMIHFQLPGYFIKMIAIAKIIGAIALLQTWNANLVRFAFYGFVMLLFGAIFMHIAVEDPIVMLLPALISLILLIVCETMRDVEIANEEYEHQDA
ncbi:MAG: hypothetical protein RL060_1713 [Bacteroidota bacterium]